jgi:hypothetical protein
VVALNVGNFFGAGTVQSANTELHQVQTAVIAAMAECESGTLNLTGNSTWWAGGYGYITADCVADPAEANDAAFFVYGPLRAAYEIDTSGRILQGSLTEASVTIGDPWTGIQWDTTNSNWMLVP